MNDMDAIFHAARMLMGKSKKLHKTAYAIFNMGDWKSCISRAYYSMFNAAKAAVLVSGAAVKLEMN